MSEDTTYEKLTDEQILSFEQEIKDSEALKHPLVSHSEDISALLQEYETGSPEFLKKIAKLQETHARIRRCRGDGNCFYRAFSFAWYDRVRSSGRESDRRGAVELLGQTMQLLESVGFEKLAFEDFYQVAFELIEEIFSSAEQEQFSVLLKRFQSDEISNSIVVYFRFVASAYLKSHAEEYLPFLDFYGTMDQFCANNVEAMGREVEQVQIIALSKAFKVPVKICYLSGSTADEVNFHDFLPDNPPTEGPFANPLPFLYRPGHYDLLEA